MISSSIRVKRMPLERTGPIRNPIVFPGPSPKPGAPQEVASAAGAAVFGLLENGVRTAYAVIDEYMRRGQDVARALFNQPNPGGYMYDYRSNAAGPSGPGGGFGPGYVYGVGNPMPAGIWNPMANMLEQWINVMRAWNYVACGCVPVPQWQPQQPQQGQPQQPWPQTQGQQAPVGPSAYAVPPAGNVILKMAATTLVECTANLVSGLPPQDLFCDQLFALAAGPSAAKPIPAPTIAFDPGSVQIFVTVPDGQEPGSYRGSIRKQSDKTAVGSLLMVVSSKPVSTGSPETAASKAGHATASRTAGAASGPEDIASKLADAATKLADAASKLADAVSTSGFAPKPVESGTEQASSTSQQGTYEHS